MKKRTLSGGYFDNIANYGMKREEIKVIGNQGTPIHKALIKMFETRYVIDFNGIKFAPIFGKSDESSFSFDLREVDTLNKTLMPKVKPPKKEGQITISVSEYDLLKNIAKEYFKDK